MTYTQKLSKLLESDLNTSALSQPIPKLSANRIGLISRDYRESSGNSDFSDCLQEVLGYCDAKECDTVLFSLFTILKSNMGKVSREFEKLKNIKSVFIEEFSIENGIRYSNQYDVFYKEDNKWKKYSICQKFASVDYTKKFEEDVINPFIKEVGKQRIFGSMTVLLCGETNIVKYNKEKKAVVDSYGLLKVIPPGTKIIMNPIHDRMTRFEMKLKRAFLSENNRLVISVWNKGKTDQKGVNRDGKNPPWTVYANGKELNLERENTASLSFSNKGLEIGIFDTI